MKHFSESFSGNLQQYMEVPEAEREQWLENQPWYQKLQNDTRYKCQACGDTGLILDGKAARRCPCILGGVNRTTRVVPETYFSLDAQLKGWEGWPVPRLAEVDSVKGFVETDSYESGKFVIEEMQSGTNRALIMCGANGRGKTFTAMMVLAEAAWTNKKCFALKMSEIIALYKGGLDTTKERNHIMNRMLGSQVALIDEISAFFRGNDIDHAQGILTDVVDTFYNQKKILLLTCNNTKKELIEILHPAIVSRISKDAGWCMVVEDTEKQNLRGSLAA